MERQDAGGTTRFVYDGDQPVLETNGSNGTSLYRTPGAGWVRNGAQRFDYETALGSTVETRDQSGAVTGRTEYDAFGVESYVGATTDRGGYRFAGAKGYPNDDATGMQLLGARYYFPKLGRFLTPDPIGHAGGLNLYAYCEDSPLMRTDASGTDWDWGQYWGGVAGVFGGYRNGAVGVVTGPYHLYRYYSANGVSLASTGALASGMWTNFIGGFSLDASPEHFGSSMFTVLSAPLPAKGLGALKGVANAARMASWARMAGVVRLASAASKAGDYGLGALSFEETMLAGEAFVGPGSRVTSGGTFMSANGLRQFRPPTMKPNIGRVQANFETRGAPSGKWTSNGHVNVR